MAQLNDLLVLGNTSLIGDVNLSSNFTIKDITIDGIINNTTAGGCGWSSNDQGKKLITLNTLAYWNGTYNGSASNLKYINATTTTVTTRMYPLWVDGSGTRQINKNEMFSVWRDSKNAYLTIGNSSNLGGITLHKGNGSYIDIKTAVSDTTTKTINLPDKSGTLAMQTTWNDFIHTGNEFTFASAGYGSSSENGAYIWLNYRTASGDTDGNINGYKFGNGKKTMDGVTVETFAFKGKKYRLTDKAGNDYSALYDNGTHLWIGAETTAAKHHVGGTYISSGYDSTNKVGNESIYISVPNAANSNATNNMVLHTGNPNRINLYGARAYTNGSANYIYKIATCSGTLNSSTNFDASLTLLATGFYGNSSYKNGILKAEVRWDKGNTSPSKAILRWLTADGKIAPENYILTYKLDSSTSKVTLNIYVTFGSTTWESMNFTKLAEHTWGDSKNKYAWTLYQATGTNGVTAIPTDETQVPSTLGDIKANSITATTVTAPTFSGNATSATKATQDGSGNTITSTYLKLSGGTMTGVLTAKGNVYGDAYEGALNMNNSNIYGLNAIYTADLADSPAEGINFYSTTTTVDSLWVKSGIMYFTPNRTLGTSGTSHRVLHTGNTSGVYYVTGNSGGTEGTWTGSNTNIPNLFTGLTIAYKINTAGASTTTLNLTTAAGASGAKTVKRNASNMTTHLPVGTVVHLTYDGTNWCWADYSTSNNNVTQSRSTTSSWRPVLSHATAGTYGTNPGTKTDQVYFHETIAIQPSTGKLKATLVEGAVWNDYAEYRQQLVPIEPGYCVASTDDGRVYKTTERFQACDGIVSDTFGFAIGETNEYSTPLAVAGRVLAYCEGDRNNYHAGDTVCAGPEGKIVKMTREEIKEYPDRIVGVVSEIPKYDIWGSGKVEVNNRIWIKVK